MSGICKYVRDSVVCPYGSSCKNEHDVNKVPPCKHGSKCTRGKDCYYGPIGHGISVVIATTQEESVSEQKLFDAYRIISDLASQLKKVSEENELLKHEMLAIDEFYKSHIEDVEHQLVCMEQHHELKEVEADLEEWAKSQ